VTSARRYDSGFWRRLAPALALIALVIRVLVPQGFMVAPAEAAGPIPLVICTGHGAVDAASLVGGPAHKPAGKGATQDAPCAFAGYAATPAPDLFTAEPVSFAAYHPHVALAAPRDLAPGRGLAAPPLPARGPPSLIL
jgi:hypothetical protein